MKCLNCDIEFTPKRITAKYCSDNCRVQSFLKRNKKVEKVTEVKLQVLYNSLLEMVGKINYLPTTPASYEGTKAPKSIFDEPLQYKKPMEHQATFQELLNGMADVHFSDDKEDYAEKIKKATHLSEKQVNLLLTNLWAKN